MAYFSQQQLTQVKISNMAARRRRDGSPQQCACDSAARRSFNPLLDEGRQVAASLFETSDA